MKRLFILMSLFLFFQNCGHPKPKREYFVGTWKSNDGASILLFENGNCEVRNLNYKNIYPFKYDTLQIINFHGSWDLLTVKGEPKIDISYYEDNTYDYKGEIRRYKRGFEFNIIGQGLLKKQPPFDLYVFIGDPDDIDESNKYRFVKQ